MDYLRQQRIYKVFLLFFLCFAFYVGRIYFIQVSSHQEYVSKMLAQDTMSVALEEYTRGNIYDRNMVPLTGTVAKNKVIVFPSVIAGKKVTIKRLAKILGLKDNEMAAKMGNVPHYLELKADLTPGQALAIAKAKLPGIQVAPVALRSEKPLLAAHTLGYLDRVDAQELSAFRAQGRQYSPIDTVGKYGLEKFYETQLRGLRPEKVMRAYVDGNGQLIPGLGYRVEKNIDPNRHSLVLTLDKRVQQIVEKVMDSKVKLGAVVVMDPLSGDILAIAGRPVAEKNGFNPAVELREPGSVFKIIVAAAALEEGKVTPDTHFFCSGKQDFIKCSDPNGHGNITFSQAMAVSCNSTFAKVGTLLVGAPKLIQYARRFGLENQNITGYPVPYDARQKLALIDSPNNIAISSIGQGTVLTSPLQVTAMSAVIASGGIYRQPRLVKELRNFNGQVSKSFPMSQGSRVISEKTAGEINDMLVGVVSQGTGKAAAIAQGSAGKTGTAEAGSGKTNAWFTGYAPFNNPRYVVTVFVEKGESGGKDAAPVFKEIMEQLMKLP